MSSADASSNMIALLSSAIVSARYIVTFDQEVQLIWMRKKTPASLLFLFIRYHALVTQVFLNAASYSIMSDNLLQILQSTDRHGICPVLTWAAFSGLRTLVLSQMNWYLVSLIFFLACGPFVINMWSLSYGVVGFNLPIVGCQCLGGVTVPTHAAHMNHTVTSMYDCRRPPGGHHLLAICRPGVRMEAPQHADPAVDTRHDLKCHHSQYLTRALLVLNALHLTLTMLSIVGLSEPASYVTEFTNPYVAEFSCEKSYKPDLSGG
ncbi:hypothetical protein PYCCODRAFT_1428961 [Trametes coccinea BRFM310]|uniref:DUF6533 domain-containing protein n=1 Tax=Trametes coccinea (strain BRFM310) TaxID=1353009 RepID=A0A1Y2I6A4_TRAC3|nr:hypothetical protein PYCCODRAFT_1428961 [Trametes coccinea BRFM310]